MCENHEFQLFYIENNIFQKISQFNTRKKLQRPIFKWTKNVTPSFQVKENLTPPPTHTPNPQPPTSGNK